MFSQDFSNYKRCMKRKKLREHEVKMMMKLSLEITIY